MKTTDIESLTNSAVQDKLRMFRENGIPEPWGKEYFELRNETRKTIERVIMSHAAHVAVKNTLIAGN